MKTRHQQRGIALVALLAIIVLGASYWIYTALNANTASASVERSKRDSDVLQQAKVALIGQITQQAANSTEPNPGRLPCPEKTTDAGTANEGLPANASSGSPFGYCGAAGAIVVGRLPWKALGLDKLQDSATEPLWYAVAPSWVIQTATGNTTINSDNPALGGLTSTTGEDAIAVLFAPGQALPGQSRQPINGVSAPVAANYLDSPNSTLGVLAQFAKTGPDGAFNDHVITITRAELMPAIEAAVADRFAKQTAPQIRSAYSSGLWTPASPVLPFAAAFSDPSAASYKGSIGVTGGLLPVSYASTGACSSAPCIPAACTPGPSDPRCAQDLVAWITSGAHTPAIAATAGMTPSGSPACSISGTPSILTCTVQASATLASGLTWMEFNLSVSAGGIGNALRQLNDTVPIAGDIDTVTIRSPYGYSISSAALNSDDSSGSVTLASRFAPGSGTSLAFVGATDCAASALYCRQFTISIPLPIFNDHPVIDATNQTEGWFVRNQWHRFSYYAIASGVAPDKAAPRTCTSGSDCLTATYLSASYPDNTLRGLIVLAGRQLAGQDRTSGARASYFEDMNAAATTTYAARAPTLVFNRTFNDRIVVIDHN